MFEQEVAPRRLLTYYRIISQSFPGFLALLMVMDKFPIDFGDFLPGSAGGGPATLAVWSIVLLASLPTGLAVSAVSFFLLGLIIFKLRIILIGTAFSAVIPIALGHPPALDLPGARDKKKWARYLHTLEAVRQQIFPWAPCRWS